MNLFKFLAAKKKQHRMVRKYLELQREYNKQFLDKDGIKPEYALHRDCPACGGMSREPAYSNGQFSFVRCTNCTLVYAYPCLKEPLLWRLYDDPNSVMRTYWEAGSLVARLTPSTASPANSKRVPVLNEILKVKPGGRLLDVGCSTGDFLEKAKFFYTVEGVEPNPATVEFAREQRKLTVHCGRMEEVSLPPESFDVVTLNGVLYGVHSPFEFLRQCRSLLRTGGICSILTANSDSLSLQFFKGRHVHLRGCTALNVFNRRSLEALGERCGLRLVSVRSHLLDIRCTDMVLLALGHRRFLHRANYHLPLYSFTSLAEVLIDKTLFGNLKGTAGSYLIAILARE